MTNFMLSLLELDACAKSLPLLMTAAKRVFDFAFVEPLDEKFKCPICHLAFRKPTLTRCGNHFVAAA